MPRNSEGGRRSTAIHRLPYEIVAVIFVIYVNQSFSGLRVWLTSSPPSKGPLPLGAVCRMWRHIAWKTTRLWTTIQFNISLKTSETFMEIAADWLSRSGRHPLSIHISGANLLSGRFITPESAGHSFVVNFTNEHASRCYCLYMHIPCSMFPLMRNVKNASALHELSVCSDGNQEDDEILDLGPQTAPIDVTISGVGLDSCVMNWNFVTTVTVAALYIDDLLELLTLAPLLKVCNVAQLFGSIDRPIEKFRSVTHSHLETLGYTLYCGQRDRDLILFFEKATLLRLTEFLCDFDDLDIPTTFTGFLSRSSGLLQNLSLRRMSVTGEVLVEVLQAAPHLIVLHVEPEVYENAFLPPGLDAFYDALSMSSARVVVLSQEKPFLPLLEKLTIMPGPEFPWHVLPGFFHRPTDSMDTPARALKEVHIRCLPLKPHEYIYPGDFIDDRSLLDELVNLRNIKLSLQTKQEHGLVDMIGLSYRMLDAYERSGGEALTDSEEATIHRLSRV